MFFKCSWEKLKYCDLRYYFSNKEPICSQPRIISLGILYFIFSLEVFQQAFKTDAELETNPRNKESQGKNNTNRQWYLIVSLIRASSWVTGNSSSVSFHCLEIIPSIVISKTSTKWRIPKQETRCDEVRPCMWWGIWVNDDWYHITFHKAHTCQIRCFCCHRGAVAECIYSKAPRSKRKDWTKDLTVLRKGQNKIK